MNHFGTNDLAPLDLDAILNSLGSPQSSAEKPLSETFTRLLPEFISSTEITSVNEDFEILTEYINSENTTFDYFKQCEAPNKDAEDWIQPNGSAPIEGYSNHIPYHFANFATPIAIDNNIQQQPADNFIQQPEAEAPTAAESMLCSLVPLNPRHYHIVHQMYDDDMSTVPVEVVVSSNESVSEQSSASIVYNYQSVSRDTDITIASDETWLQSVPDDFIETDNTPVAASSKRNVPKHYRRKSEGQPKPKRVRRTKPVDKNSEEYKASRDKNNASVKKTRSKKKSEIEQMQYELTTLREENLQLHEKNKQLLADNMQVPILHEEIKRLRAENERLLAKGNHVPSVSNRR